VHWSWAGNAKMSIIILLLLILDPLLLYCASFVTSNTPSEIFVLLELEQYFYDRELSGNNLSGGQIPSDIGNLTNLLNLDLD